MIVIWNVLVPVLIGFLPLAMFYASFPPPLEPWWDHPEWLLQLAAIAGAGVVAGAVGRLSRAHFGFVAASFCAAQSALLLLGSSRPDLGPVESLVGSLLLEIMIAAIPLVVGFGIGGALARWRPDLEVGSAAPDAGYSASQLSGMVCGRCGQPFEHGWRYRCRRCFADFEDYPPVTIDQA